MGEVITILIGCFETQLHKSILTYAAVKIKLANTSIL